MSVGLSRATLNAVTSWLREARAVTGLAALPGHIRERAEKVNERLRRRVQYARSGRWGAA